MASLLGLGMIIGVATVHAELLQAIERQGLKYPAEFREWADHLAGTYPRSNVLVLPPGTEVKGDLDLDWGHTDEKQKIVAIVARGDLRVTGTVRNSDLDGGPTLFVMGNLRAGRIDKGGAIVAILGRVEVEDYVLCEYNHGVFRVGGDLKCKALLNLDHDVLISGKTSGKSLSWDDDDLRDVLVPEVFDLAADPETTLPDGALLRKRIAAGLPLFKKP